MPVRAFCKSRKLKKENHDISLLWHSSAYLRGEVQREVLEYRLQFWSPHSKEAHRGAGACPEQSNEACEGSRAQVF